MQRTIPTRRRSRLKSGRGRHLFEGLEAGKHAEVIEHKCMHIHGRLISDTSPCGWFRYEILAPSAHDASLATLEVLPVPELPYSEAGMPDLAQKCAVLQSLQPHCLIACAWHGLTPVLSCC